MTFQKLFQDAAEFYRQEDYMSCAKTLSRAVMQLDTYSEKHDRPKVAAGVLRARALMLCEGSTLDEFKIAATCADSALLRVQRLYGENHTAVAPIARLAATIYATISDHYAMIAGYIEAEDLCPDGTAAFDGIAKPESEEDWEAFRKDVDPERRQRLKMPESGAGRMIEHMEERANGTSTGGTRTGTEERRRKPSGS